MSDMNTDTALVPRHVIDLTGVFDVTDEEYAIFTAAGEMVARYEADPFDDPFDNPQYRQMHSLAVERLIGEHAARHVSAAGWTPKLQAYYEKQAPEDVQFLEARRVGVLVHSRLAKRAEALAYRDVRDWCKKHNEYLKDTCTALGWLYAHVKSALQWLDNSASLSIGIPKQAAMEPDKASLESIREKADELQSEEDAWVADAPTDAEYISRQQVVRDRHVQRSQDFEPARLVLPPLPPDEYGDVELYSDAEQLEDWFAYYMTVRAKRKYPYVHVSIPEAKQRVARLARLARESESSLIETPLANMVATSYHHEMEQVNVGDARGGKGRLSPYEAFQDDDLVRLVLEQCLEEDGTITRSNFYGKLGRVRSAQRVSNFRPGFALWMYRYLKCPPNGVVLDTSMGYGGRMIGYRAARINGTYIGIDPEAVTCANNLRMARELGFAHLVRVINKPAEKVDADEEALRGVADCAFTSPPYFDREKYGGRDNPAQSHRYNTDETGQLWREKFLEPMLALQFAALKPGALSAINIANIKRKGVIVKLVDWTITAAEKAGFDYLAGEKIEYPLKRRRGANQPREKVFEPVLVFRKPL